MQTQTLSISTTTINALQVNPSSQNERKNSVTALLAAMAMVNGVLYFFVASAGVDNVRKLFEIENPETTKDLLAIGIGASLCYGMFSYKLLENLTLRPTSPLSKALVVLAPISASKFLTAGIEGAETVSEYWVKMPSEAWTAIGISLFVLRAIAMIDGSVKFPSKIAELKNAFTDAIANKDFVELARIIITFYTALGFAISSTDAVYAAVSTLAQWLGANPTDLAVTVPSFIASGLGAMGLFPLTLYWTLRGIRQATNGGKPDARGVIADPTDRHTIIGTIGTLPVVLGVLGAVTSSSGQVFGRAGTTASVVRVSSAFIYAVAGGIPGLSTLSRNVSTLFCSEQRKIESIDIEAAANSDERKPLLSSMSRTQAK